MKTRPLGRTGIVVSEIGFGAWGLGATMWKGVSEEEGSGALAAALEAGVTFIDTALAYGDGHSVRIIAKVLAGRHDRHRVHVATKIPPMNMVWPASRAVPISRVFPADYVRQCTERSLRHLGRERLDVQQFHVWHDVWLQQEAWHETRREMDRLKQEGKVAHWGISVNDHAPETALLALDDLIFETAQVIYNIFDRSPETQLFPLARERDLGIIVRVPFDEGALTGAIRPDSVFPDGDWRHRYFRGNRKAEAARRADALKTLLGKEAQTLPELALRFILSSVDVTCVIPGMRRAANVFANVAVSDGRRLTPEFLAALHDHAWKKNWYGD